MPSTKWHVLYLPPVANMRVALTADQVIVLSGILALGLAGTQAADRDLQCARLDVFTELAG